MKIWRKWSNPHLGKSYVVKVGISWPGFFLGIFWMIYKGLWRVMAYGFVLTIVYVAGVGYLVNYFDGTQESIEWLNIIFAMIINVTIAVYGNQWFEASLWRRGYQRVDQRRKRLDYSSQVPVSVSATTRAASGFGLESTCFSDSYVSVWGEIYQQLVHPDTWLKAYADSGGDRQETNSRYVDYRARVIHERSAAGVEASDVYGANVQHARVGESMSLGNGHEYNPSTATSVLTVVGAYVGLTILLPVAMVGLVLIFSSEIRADFVQLWQYESDEHEISKPVSPAIDPMEYAIQLDKLVDYTTQWLYTVTDDQRATDVLPRLDEADEVLTGIAIELEGTTEIVRQPINRVIKNSLPAYISAAGHAASNSDPEHLIRRRIVGLLMKFADVGGVDIAEVRS